MQTPHLLARPQAEATVHSQHPKVAGHEPPPRRRLCHAVKAVPGSSTHEQLRALAQHLGQHFGTGGAHICPAVTLNRAQDSTLSACPELYLSTLKQFNAWQFLPFLLAPVLVWPHSVLGPRAKTVTLTPQKRCRLLLCSLSLRSGLVPAQEKAARAISGTGISRLGFL